MNDSLAARLAHDVDLAFPDLVDTHGSMVLTLAVRLTDRSTGEDIAQEVFLRSYRALQTYDAAQRSKLDLRPWLATITRNLVRNEYRRRDRKPTESLGQGSETVVAPVDIAIEVIDGRDSVDELLAGMPEDQRDAVVLRHVVGLPMREVALTLGCPEGTAKSHVSRGVGRLRDALDRQAVNDVRSADQVGTDPAGATEGEVR